MSEFRYNDSGVGRCNYSDYKHYDETTLRSALGNNSGDINKAAKDLDLSPEALLRKLQEKNIPLRKTPTENK